MKSNPSDFMRIVLIIFVIGVILGLGIFNYRFILQAPGGNDFLPRWMGANYWLVRGIQPYHPQVSLAAQNMIYGRPANLGQGEDLAHFAYPLPAMIFFAPFGLLPFPLARAIWMTILEIGLLLLAFLGIQLARWKIKRNLLVFMMVFSILWYHGFRSIIVGQFAVIEAVLITGALLAIQRGQDNLAGILLGLSIAKPQMSFLLILFILLWGIQAKRWELILWFLGSFGVLIGISLVLLPNWILLWLRQILEYPKYTDIGSPLSIVAGVVPTASQGITYGLTALFVIYMVWEWLLALNKDTRWFVWTASLTLVITNLVAFRTATTNYVIMLPVLSIVFGTWCERWTKKGIIYSVFVLLILLIGLWALFLRTVVGNTESAIMYIPLPFISLLCLWWSRWWTTQASGWPFERYQRT